MSWNCKLTEERLSDFLEGVLLPEEMAAFSAHSAECERCKQIVAQVGGLVSRMQRIPLVEQPPLLVGKILAATLGPRKQERASEGLFGWLSSIWQPRFAMGMATVAASFVIVFHAAGSGANKSVLNPMNLLRAGNRQAHLTYAHGVKFVNDLRVVYEIQSLLASQPQPMSEPVSAPPATPSSEPKPGGEPQSPSSAPRQKSETIPHSDRREMRGGNQLALMPYAGMSESLSNTVSRSLL